MLRSPESGVGSVMRLSLRERIIVRVVGGMLLAKDEAMSPFVEMLISYSY